MGISQPTVGIDLDGAGGGAVGLIAAVSDLDVTFISAAGGEENIAPHRDGDVTNRTERGVPVGIVGTAPPIAKLHPRAAVVAAGELKILSRGHREIATLIAAGTIATIAELGIAAPGGVESGSASRKNDGPGSCLHSQVALVVPIIVETTIAQLSVSFGAFAPGEDDVAGREAGAARHVHR